MTVEVAVFFYYKIFQVCKLFLDLTFCGADSQIEDIINQPVGCFVIEGQLTLTFDLLPMHSTLRALVLHF